MTEKERRGMDQVLSLIHEPYFVIYPYETVPSHPLTIKSAPEPPFYTNKNVPWDYPRDVVMRG